MALLRDHLPRLPRLRSLTLGSFDCTSQQAAALGASLPKLAGLETVELKWFPLRPALLSGLQALPALRTLRLLNSQGPSRMEAAQVAAALSPLRKLRALSLPLYDLADPGVSSILTAIANLTGLEWLHLSGASLGSEGASALASCLTRLGQLTHFKLERIVSAAKATDKIDFASLSNLARLKYLDLGTLQVGPLGSAALGSALPHLTSLVSLALPRFQDGPADDSDQGESSSRADLLAPALAGLKDLPELRRLDVGRDARPRVASLCAGMPAVSRALSELRFFDPGVRVGATDFGRLCEILPEFKGATILSLPQLEEAVVLTDKDLASLAAGLASLPLLEDVALSGLKLGAAQPPILVEALSRLRRLAVVDVSGCSPSS